MTHPHSTPVEKSSTLSLFSDDLNARQARWGTLISDLEADCDSDGGGRDKNDPPVRNPGAAALASPMMLGVPSSNPFMTVKSPTTINRNLRSWIKIKCQQLGQSPSIQDKKEYFEQSVRILHSLVKKITAHSIPARLIHAENTAVIFDAVAKGTRDAADFVETSSQYSFESNDNTVANDITQINKKQYESMNALGKMGYQLFMQDKGPNVSMIPWFNYSRRKDTENALSKAMNIHDNDDIIHENDITDMIRNKTPRKISSDEKRGVTSTMLDAGVPYPLCRFVADLLDGDGNNGVFRSENSFSSFSDVLSDLKQMMDRPDTFIHASATDRWKMAGGDKLYGREKETEILMDAAGRVVKVYDDPIFDGIPGLRTKIKEVVLVAGHSGSGKSSLVKESRVLLEEQGWICLCCKFDRVLNPEPLSVISHAFDKYFESCANCPKHGVIEKDVLLVTELKCCCPGQISLDNMRQHFDQIVGAEGMGILSKHMPSLRLLFPTAPSEVTHEVTQKQIHYLFIKILQAISHSSATLFFADDLQWADLASLELFTELVNGADSDFSDLSTIGRKKNNHSNFKYHCNVMFIGTYRDNEVASDHRVGKAIRKFQDDSSINVTNILLSGLSLETVSYMISESLCLPVRRTRSLSEMIIQKTAGEPLFVIEFLETLMMNKLLTHSFVRGWEWDADSIDNYPITDSVAELFTIRLKRLPEDVILGLQVISLFGSHVDDQILDFVADYNQDGSDNTITGAISVALREGMVERSGHTVSFSHDMIQQSTMTSIKEDELVPLLSKLVASLIKNSSAANKTESVIFVAVDLMNRIENDAVVAPKLRNLYAQFNNRAGRLAMAVPDFSSALKYSEYGISFLNENNWETQYDLSLSLYETAIISHHSSLESNHDELMKKINEVFDNVKDVSDAFNTHFIWIKALSMSSLTRAIEESLIVLERLGESLDPSKLQLSIITDEVMKRKEQFSGNNKESILSSRRMTDPNKLRCMKIYSSLALYYHQQRTIMSIFIPCRMIDLSMMHGHCEDSAFGAAAFASVLVNNMGDIDEGTSWAMRALSLMKLYDTNSLIPSIHAVVYGLILVWKEPLQSTLEPLLESCRLSFATGNIEFAIANTICYVARSHHFVGKNIDILLGEVEAFARHHGQLTGNDIENRLIQFYLTPLYNTLRQLKGEPEEPLAPLNKFLNSETILQKVMEKNELASAHAILTHQIMEAFIFRNMEKSLRMTDLFLDIFKEEYLQYVPIYRVFYGALVAFYFYREHSIEEEKYIARAKNAVLTVKDWSQRYSCWNFSNKYFLLSAEEMFTEGNFELADEYYNSSIKAARDHRFIHEEAIACELAGYFHAKQGAITKSHDLFEESYHAYMKWGAVKKANMLKPLMGKV